MLGDGLGAGVGGQGVPSSFRRRSDLAHLVHVYERVEGGQFDLGERRLHGKPSPSKPTRLTMAQKASESS